jgi:predicted RNA methylase
MPNKVIILLFRMYQTTGLNRSNLDKYYTKPDIAKQLVETFLKHVPHTRHDVFIEPAAGDGAFVPFIKPLSKHTHFFDIMPDDQHKRIVKQDYLQLDIESFLNRNRKIHVIGKNKVHVIGNPPFGRQAGMAKRFIAKSASFADTIAFVLPKSFKKTSMQASFPLNWHLKHQHDLKDNAFTVNSQDLDVPSVFQIWYRDDTKKRRVPKRLEPVGFRFVRKTDSPDFAVRRIGFYAGNVVTNPSDKSEESHLFVKANKKTDIRHIQSSFDRLTFSHGNTVGPRSVSKQELLRKLSSDMRRVV